MRGFVTSAGDASCLPDEWKQGEFVSRGESQPPFHSSPHPPPRESRALRLRLMKGR